MCTKDVRSMDAPNYDNLANMYEELPVKQGHFLMPQWPFRLIMLGPSGSGKTNLLMDIIFHYLYFDRLYIYCKGSNENKYAAIKEFMELVAEKKKVPLSEVFFMGTEKDIPDPNEYDKQYQNLCIYDDMVTLTAREQNNISQMYIRGRKENCSSIYLSQSYFKIPKDIREQTNYVVIYRLDDIDDVMRIRRRHGTRISVKDFLKLYHECTEEKNKFMLLDNRTDELPLAFRKGWDGVLNIGVLTTIKRV